MIRNFRDLSDKEAADPETLAMFAAFGGSTTFDWAELLKSERVLLLSEAGTGKTYECQMQAKRLRDDGQPAFFIPLEALARAPIDNYWSADEARRFTEWRADGSSTATFFLDSIDEMQLSHGVFRTALRHLGRSIDGQLARARIVVTSRPIAIDAAAFREELPIPGRKIIEDEPEDPGVRFCAIMSGEVRRARRKAGSLDDDAAKGAQPWRTVALMPLSDSQVESFIAMQGVTDGSALIAEIDKRRVWDFARRPQDLIEMSAYWREHRALGARAEQVAQNIAVKLGEVGPRRLHSTLSDAKALEGAERLALGLALTRKKSMRVSDHSLDDDEADIALDPRIVLDDWSDAERAALLQRPLFGFSSYGRVRFHHRSVYEYLAAQRLHKLVADNRMPTSALFRLLFGERYGQAILFPSMRPVAAWLALRNDRVRDEVLRREPEALLDEGDPESFPLGTRKAILDAFAARYGVGGWRGFHVPIDQVRRFAEPGLSPVVRRLWDEGVTNPDVKELLIDLIQAGRLIDCLDIAHAMAADASLRQSDRVTAVDAIADMTPSGELAAFIERLLATDDPWPSDLKARVLDGLFPKHLSVAQFVTLLSQITISRRVIGGLDWHLPKIMAGLTADRAIRDELRDRLSTLMLDHAEAGKDWPPVKSRYGHLGTGLAALCSIDLDPVVEPAPELVRACVTANRFSLRDYGEDKLITTMRQFYRADSPVAHRAAFHAEAAFCARFRTPKDAWNHRFHILHDGLIANVGVEDFDWIATDAVDIGRSQIDREALFHLQIGLCRIEEGWDEARLERCRQNAQIDPALNAILDDALRPRIPDPEVEASEAKWHAESVERDRKEAKRLADWEKWRADIIADPAPYFTNVKRAATVQDFYSFLAADDSNPSARTGSDRGSILESFSEAVAVHVESAFKWYWRTLDIPLMTERPPAERNTSFYSWLYGLTGVYAEAAAPGWADNLTSTDAARAARIATLELSGIPPWLTDLVVRRPDELDATLGNELSAQLDAAFEFEHPDLLADFSHGANELKAFFAPRIWSWLSAHDLRVDSEVQQRRLHTHLDKAIAICLEHGRQESDAVVDLSRRHLASGLASPFALLWALLLLRLDAPAAVTLIKSELPKLAHEQRSSFTENLFAALGERRGVSYGPELSSAQFDPPLLLRFLRIAYAEIARENDIDRAGTGVYSPTARDDAQRGRDAILSALLAARGAAAWDAKCALAADPLFADFADRMQHVAREHAAAEAEGTATCDADLRHIDRYGEAPPADRDGMFALMLDRIDDLQHDMVHEFSERSLLATITEETIMQSSLAKRLAEKSNSSYRVDREAEVVDAKKTDIRMLSIRSNQQAVIEIKLGEKKRSAKDLVDALRLQLVGQYLRHDNCRAGCLLITLGATTRTWRAPDTNRALDFAELIAFLNTEAARIADEFGHQLRLEVRGLDLRPTKA